MKSEAGETLVDYAIMVALIALVIIGMVILLGEKTNSVFNQQNIILDQSPPEERPPEPPK